MKTIKTIIEHHGGLEALKEEAIRIENQPYMVLCIEYMGVGPRGLPMVSVAHYYKQNGDLMRDPDMVFEVTPDMETWGPVSYQQDNMGIYQEAVFMGNGQVMIRPKLVKELKTFARTWDRNLDEQGFESAHVSER